MSVFPSSTVDERHAVRADVAAPFSKPMSSSGRGRLFIVAGLLVLWFVLRFAIALKEDVLYPDGVTYIGLAARMENAATHGKLDPRLFNAYPAILMLLHQTGCDWETAGRAWGVLCGTLIVLPLYGWLRRLYNDEIAVVGCILAGLHPKLIEWSPQLIRDPTFCLFAICSLYAGWRAASELRVTWFVAAGLATFAAMQTRIEGWFLLFPQMIWLCRQAWRAPGLRLRFAFGALCASAALPLGILLINLLFGELFSSWIWGGNLHKVAYLEHVPVVCELIPAELFPDSSPPIDPADAPEGVALPPPPAGARHAMVEPIAALTPLAQSAGDSAAAMSSSPELLIGSIPSPINALQATWLLGRALVRGFGPVYATLFAIGLVDKRRPFNIDQRAMLAFVAATISAIWLHTWQSKVTSSRYALPLVLAGAPYAAAGFLAAAEFLSHRFAAIQTLAQRAARSVSFAPQQIIAAALLGILSVVTIADSFLGHDSPYRPQHALGHWIRKEVGSHRRLAGPNDLFVAAFYAEADYYYKPRGSESLSSLIREQSPDVLLLTADGAPQVAQADYRRVDTKELPPECRSRYVVLIRQPLQVRRDCPSPR